MNAHFAQATVSHHLKNPHSLEPDCLSPFVPDYDTVSPRRGWDEGSPLSLCLSLFCESPIIPFQLKMIRGHKTQKRPVDHPIPNIVIETSSSFNPLLDLFREMGVAEDDDLKSFHKFLMGKGLEGRWGHVLMIMIFLIAHIA